MVNEYGANLVENLKEDMRYYRVTVQGRTHATLEVTGFSAATDLDLFLEDDQGAVLAKSSKPGAAAESVETALDTGTYYARVQRSGPASSSSYTISMSGMQAMTDPDIASFGNFLEEYRRLSNLPPGQHLLDGDDRDGCQPGSRLAPTAPAFCDRRRTRQ